MKCPDCGAEVSGNICDYCGCSLEPQKNKVGCPNCGSSNIQFTRERQGSVKDLSLRRGIILTHKKKGNL
mgnify:CR=1 FL=1